MKEYRLNKVDGFNPYDYLQEARNRRGEIITKSDGSTLKYLSTAAKVLWFRMVYPEGVISVEPVRVENADGYTTIRFKAAVRTSMSDPMPVAEWQHQESVWDVADIDETVSKVQTIALGKALSKAGFGCEIELDMDIVSEGEAPEEEKPVTAEKPVERKKRGRPAKKVEEPAEVVEAEVDDLLATIEAAVEAEKPAKEEKGEDMMEKALGTVISCTETAPLNIRKLEGKTLKEVIDMHPTFCNLVKNRPNIKQGLTEEVVKAALYIADN